MFLKRCFTLVLVTAFCLACNPNGSVTVFTIGDSTMADKPNPESNPERGWGQMLPEFFNESVTVRNFAVNGRSTKSFIDEGRWKTVRDELKAGDYVFIQFGHNDQKSGDPKRYTNPFTGYRRNLVKFVEETREKGGISLLLSPIVRRNFNESGVLEDTHGIYPFIMRSVAQELSVPFIDLQLKSEDLVLSLGQEKSKELYLWIEPGTFEMYPEGMHDNTHFTERGARAMAKLAVDGIREQNLQLARDLKTSN